MLRINCKNICHDRDSNPKPTAWERCCPNFTAVIYFWIKRVGDCGLIKERKTTLLNEYFFLHITYAAKNNNNRFLFPENPIELTLLFCSIKFLDCENIYFYGVLIVLLGFYFIACFFCIFCDLVQSKEFPASFEKFDFFFKRPQSCVGVQERPCGPS